MSQLTFGVANFAWQRDDREREADLLDWLAEHADVVLGVETYDIPVRRHLPKSWKVWQPQRDAGRRNAVVAVRPGVQAGRPQLAPTAKTPRGVRMRRRWIPWRYLVLDGRPLRAGAYHRPPPRFKLWWRLYDLAVGRWLRADATPAVLGGDMNQRKLEWLVRTTGYSWERVGIMGALIAPELRVVKVAKIRHPASDHVVLLITVEWRRPIA